MSEKDYLPHVPCEHCRQMVSIYDAKEAKKFYGEQIGWVTHQFCSDNCRNEYFLASLRRDGL